MIKCNVSNYGGISITYISSANASIRNHSNKIFPSERVKREDAEEDDLLTCIPHSNNLSDQRPI